MNGWAIALVVLFLADAALSPTGVGTVRTSGQMTLNAIVDLLLAVAVLLAVGVL